MVVLKVTENGQKKLFQKLYMQRNKRKRIQKLHKIKPSKRHCFRVYNKLLESKLNK